MASVEWSKAPAKKIKFFDVFCLGNRSLTYVLRMAHRPPQHGRTDVVSIGRRSDAQGVRRRIARKLDVYSDRARNAAS